MIDGLFIYYLTKELNHELTKARLEKIVQDSAQSFVFYFYHQRERKQLTIDLSPEHFRINLTQKRILEQTSSQFLNTLKKHLEGAIIERFEQYETDRVLLLHFTSYDLIDGPKTKTLVFEAMGKHSNLILIKDGLIIDTFKKMFFTTGRQLLPQATFEFFPSEKQNASVIHYENIFSPQDLVSTYMGISPMLAQYLYDHSYQWDDLKVNPTRSITKKRFYVIDLFDSEDEKKSYPTLSELLDDSHQKEKPRYASQTLFIEKQLKKFKGKKSQLEASYEDTVEQLTYKTYGDLIYGSGLDLSQRVSHIEGLDHVVLDSSKTLNENAQDYYKKYQKAKRGLLHIEEQIKQTHALIDHFESLSVFMSMSSIDSIKDLEKELVPYGYKKAKPEPTKKKKDKPQLLTLKDGDIIYTVGRNNLQNEYITHTLAQKDDYWFHVKDAPGAHVIVNTSKLDEPVLRKACMLAAYFSGLKHSSSIPVDYTLVKHIKKIPGLPGYQVTYRNQQTMYIDIDEEKINLYLKNV